MIQPPQAHSAHASRHVNNAIDIGDRPSAREASSTVTKMSLKTINTSSPTSTGSLSLNSLPGQHGIPIPTTFIQYPGGFYPAIPTSSNELKQVNIAQYQTLNAHAAFPTDLSKMKTPLINRNYLELAMLVCNTFRGKLFPCPHCRYVTDRRNNLKRHISTMHQACDKVLECCGVTFTTKASLREHIMIFHHNGYSCPYCGRRFCRKALLKRHLSVHSGQKDFSCPHCDYATSHKSNLERHKRIHERLRNVEETTSFFRENEDRGLPSFPSNTNPDLDQKNIVSQSLADDDISDEEINVTSTEDEIEV